MPRIMLTIRPILAFLVIPDRPRTTARVICALCCCTFLLSGSALDAQRTIPEAIAEANHSLGRIEEIETGPAPSVELVLNETDLIVSGTVGQPLSYLSSDQKHVLTDFPILQPVYLFPVNAGATARPDVTKPISVTQSGGTIAVLGHRYTEGNKQLPLQSPGMKGLFLLKRVGTQYHIATRLYGAFRIDTPLFTPLAADEAFAAELRQLRPDEATSRLLAIIAAKPAK